MAKFYNCINPSGRIGGGGRAQGGLEQVALFRMYMRGDLKFESLVFYAKRIFVSSIPPRDSEIEPLLGAETKSKHLTPVGAGEG